MASLVEAIRTTLAYERQSGAKVYNGSVSHFLIGNAPHGGYIVSLCTHATLLHQQSTPHRDPAHLSAQFFSPCRPGRVQVEIKAQSISKRWTRLDVSLWQFDTADDVTTKRIERVRLHYLFTDLPSPPEWNNTPTAEQLSVVTSSNSPFARPSPLLTHPSKCSKAKMYPSFQFTDAVEWSTEVEISPEESSPPSTDPYKKMHSAFWWSQTSPEDDALTNVALVPFFADMFKNGPELIEKVHHTNGKYWFPTLTFALEFKAKYPIRPIKNSPGSSGGGGGALSKSTVGIYFLTKSITDGRHDQTVEVWTSPGEIGEGDETVGGKDWRKESQLIAISTQSALVIPFSVNQKIANRSAGNGNGGGKL